jgi:acyl-CoA hydrolase
MEGKSVSQSLVTMSQVMMPQDANPAGNIHGGVIMKHIDDAAAVVALRHTGTLVVTASIDRLSFHHPVRIGDLLTLKGSLNMVGGSSMEIGIRVESENLISREINHIASAYLTYVALDENLRPKKVDPLILETEGEKRRHAEAMERKKIRLAEREKEAKQQKESNQ